MQLPLRDRVEIDFAHHAPNDQETLDKHIAIRAACKDLAHVLVDLTCPGREQSTALTKLEEVMMWSNASVARFAAQQKDIERLATEIDNNK